MNVEAIARICHEANKTLCEIHGDYSQVPWDVAADWQREAAIEGVQFALANPDAPAYTQHDAWSEDKLRDGWKFGPVKDADKKEHPMLIPFDKLPPEQQAKDFLFQSVVRGLAQFVNGS